jgi:hypothetical protein
MNKLLEGLDYHDLDGQLDPLLSVDEYAAKMGKDCDIITLAFIIRNEKAGEDLVAWFERGYNFVLDAQVSEGELSPGKYLIFVEMARRLAAPKRIIEILDDLTTLTDIPLKEWKIKIDDKEYPAEEEKIEPMMILSPHIYREKNPEEEEEADGAEIEKDSGEIAKADIEKEEELNEMRKAAGLQVKRLYNPTDAEMKNFKAMAGL